MAFRIAKELCIYDVDGMLSESNMRLFLEWCAYFRVEPFGEERGDLRAGVIASVIVNALSKNANATPDKFVLFSNKPKEQTSDRLRNKLMAFTRQYRISQAVNGKKTDHSPPGRRSHSKD